MCSKGNPVEKIIDLENVAPPPVNTSFLQRFAPMTSPNAFINDSVLSYVQWSPPTDHNFSISSSTPMKPTNHVVNVEITGVRSRAQRTRRIPST